MDVDQDEEGQGPKKVKDYGIEPDFDELDEEDKEVSSALQNPVVRG